MDHWLHLWHQPWFSQAPLGQLSLPRGPQIPGKVIPLTHVHPVRRCSLLTLRQIDRLMRPRRASDCARAPGRGPPLGAGSSSSSALQRVRFLNLGGRFQQWVLFAQQRRASLTCNRFNVVYLSDRSIGVDIGLMATFSSSFGWFFSLLKTRIQHFTPDTQKIAFHQLEMAFSPSVNEMSFSLAG